MDAAQGHLAGQIAVFQFLADDFAAQIHVPGLDMQEMYRLTRLADGLTQTVSRMEPSLERRKFRVMPFRDVRAVDGFDLDALDATWCHREWVGGPVSGAGPMGSPVDNPLGSAMGKPVGNRVENPAASTGHHETAIPRAAVGEQDLVARPAKPALGRAATERVEPRAETAGGGPAASATAAAEGPPSRPGIPPSGGVARPDGVTLEQGDGWTLEVWPARPGARAGSGAAEPDDEADGASTDQAGLVSRRPDGTAAAPPDGGGAARGGPREVAGSGVAP